MWEAVEKGHTQEVCQAVLAGNITLDEQDPHELAGKTVLHLAAWWGHVDLMVELLALGANARSLACFLRSPPSLLCLPLSCSSVLGLNAKP